MPNASPTPCNPTQNDSHAMKLPHNAAPRHVTFAIYFQQQTLPLLISTCICIATKCIIHITVYMQKNHWEQAYNQIDALMPLFAKILMDGLTNGWTNLWSDAPGYKGTSGIRQIM